MKRNVGGQFTSVELTSVVDGSAITGGTTEVWVTKDNGTQGLSGTAVHKGKGSWTYAASQSDTNAGYVIFTFVNPSAVSAFREYYPTSDFDHGLIATEVAQSWAVDGASVTLQNPTLAQAYQLLAVRSATTGSFQLTQIMSINPTVPTAFVAALDPPIVRPTGVNTQYDLLLGMAGPVTNLPIAKFSQGVGLGQLDAVAGKIKLADHADNAIVIANAVWNALKADHVTASTYGADLASATQIVTALMANVDMQTMLAGVNGDWTFTPPASLPGTGTVVVKDKAGLVTLANLILTFNSAGYITARSSV